MSTSVVLFSGGIDSTTALYWAQKKRDDVRALTFDYGQRHRVEVRHGPDRRPAGWASPGRSSRSI